jgi:membrane fusion protein (multidrug efflux system)
MKTFFTLRKSIVYFLIILLVGGYGYKKYHKTSVPLAEESSVVEVVAVKEASIPMTAHAIGTLSSAKNVVITAEIAGQVASINTQDGAFVKAGTPIIQLDDSVYKAKLESAKANLNYSETNYKRMILLGKQGAISQQAIDQALADLKEKKAIADEAEVMVNKMSLVAPFDGVLGKINVNVGAYVEEGQECVTLVDTQHLRVEYSVPENYVAQLKQGQEVTLTTAIYPNQTFIGKVAYISPTINVSNRTINLYADVPNEKGLLTAGLFVNVSHALGETSHALLIPNISLMPTLEGQEVYKVVNGKAVAVSVKLGERTEKEAQITEGLSRGDQVVIAGQQKLKEGSLVKIKN